MGALLKGTRVLAESTKQGSPSPGGWSGSELSQFTQLAFTVAL